ncbi:MAG TPA: glycosyltransferase family A protein [Thermoleophilaceae bacterium]|nr:glycosyltransferase family A protein [Thermoleophilaceae bacterium]
MNPPTDRPRIAVLIPCYNDGELIGETLTSLLQDRDLEIVIIDDASTDEATLETLRGLEAEGLTVVWRKENGGVARARADGLQASSAPYVYPLDADDVTIPGTISQMADRLDEDPGAAVCFGDYEEFGLTEVVRAVPEHLDPFRVAYANEYPVSSLFRRSVLDDLGGWTAGGFDERSHEDWNLWMALVENGYRGVHLGPGQITYRRRLADGRLLGWGKQHHPMLYRKLKAAHPKLFADIDRYRRESDLPRSRKLLYPYIYGGRKRRAFEPKLKELLDRVGFWTLRR